jgi:hypothetical protein
LLKLHSGGFGFAKLQKGGFPARSYGCGRRVTGVKAPNSLYFPQILSSPPPAKRVGTGLAIGNGAGRIDPPAETKPELIYEKSCNLR